jgi:hypothetical protein
MCHCLVESRLGMAGKCLGRICSTMNKKPQFIVKEAVPGADRSNPAGFLNLCFVKTTRLVELPVKHAMIRLFPSWPEFLELEYETS